MADTPDRLDAAKVRVELDCRLGRRESLVIEGEWVARGAGAPAAPRNQALISPAAVHEEVQRWLPDRDTAATEAERLRTVTHAQHAELLQLRAAVARLHALCAAQPGPRVYVEEVLAALGDPGREASTVDTTGVTP
jgi:hypothetical protein